MEIKPYPEEQRCQNCVYARIIEGSPTTSHVDTQPQI